MTASAFSASIAPSSLSRSFNFRLFTGSFRCWCCALFIFFQAGVLPAQEPRYAMADTAVAKRLLGEAVTLIGSAQYDAALGKLDTAGVILEGTVGREDTRFAKVLHQKGRCFYRMGDYDQTIKNYRSALEIAVKHYGSKHIEVASYFHNLGNPYFKKGDYAQALLYYGKALNIRLDVNVEHPDVPHSYNNLGAVYATKGDLDHAIECFQKALYIRLKILPPDHIDVAINYSNLANAYNDKNQYDRAAEHYQKALEIWLKKDPQHPEAASTYLNLGILHRRQGYYEQALEFTQKALEIKLNTSGFEHPDVANVYNYLADVYLEKGNYEQTIHFAQKALEIWSKSTEFDNHRAAYCYNTLGKAFNGKGDYNRAIEYHQKALKIRLNIFGYEHPNVAWSYNNLSKLYKSKGDYTRSIDHVKKALFSITACRKNLGNPGSKSTLAENAAGVYEGGITVNLLFHRLTDSLHYLREAFDYAEQSKAQNLYESMKNADALHFAGIPDSLLDQEYDLRIDIAYNDKRKHELLLDTTRNETDTTALAISSKLFDLNRAYENLIHTFETGYPDYYRLKYDFSTVGAREVQDSLLQQGQTLLQCVVGDSSIFLFAVGKDTLRLVEIKKDFPLEAWVDSLRQSMAEQYTSRVLDYCRLAHLLYQKLVLPVKDLLTQELIIVPDGVLGYLPFEALLTEQPQYTSNFHLHPYLLRDYQISYCYSATLLREMRNKQHRLPAEKPLLAMAPFYDGLAVTTGFGKRQDLKPLPHTGEEVRSIRQIMGGEAFYKKDATEERFVEWASDYRVLHLATHGQASSESGDYSFLAFSEIKDSVENELLFVRELYNLALNADMVVLSACETGIGELKRGEGIISLARAFAYAGAKSIVTSLWSVDDEKTKDLMVGFYLHLKEGLPKDKALWQAKLDYINSRSVYAEAHPFFWAGFIAIGDMRPLGF